MLEIYEYENALNFLQDACRQRKVKNPKFSVRTWAKDLGFKGNASLSLILQGKRKIPRKHAHTISRSLNLGIKESLYFESLIELQNAKNPEDKNFFLERLNKLSPKRRKLQMQEIENFRFLSDPLHFEILELTELRGFRPDAKWIQSRLILTTSLRTIEDAVARLDGLGLLKRTKNLWQKTHTHLTSRSDFTDAGIQEYHRKVSQKAQETLSQTAVLEREFNGYCFNVSTTKLLLIKNRIREFLNQMIHEFEAPAGQGDRLYQLNLQFFPLSRKDPKV